MKPFVLAAAVAFALAPAISLAQTAPTSTASKWVTAWAASVWNNTPRARHKAPMARTGWMTPISLLA